MFFSKKILPETPSSRHSLFQLHMPAGGMQRLLRVYPNEVKLLLWVTAIQVVMSTSSILVNNVAQTTFLKRYGSDALPAVFMLEAMITFFFAGFVSLLMERYRTIRVFTGLLLFYGICMAIIRMMIPMGVDLVYPILYILKSQAVGILPILYWDILNDMFTTQQSKRLYTLISAGGILGTTFGSLMTRKLSIWVGTDNILLIFICGMVLAAVLNELTEKVVGTPLQSRIKQNREKPQRNQLAVLKEFIQHAKDSTLIKYMILLLAIPNMILPLLDYQFNVLVDTYFASEALTLQFFGIFRGVSNALMFALLMGSSRLITRWGIPTSLLFHPINYCIAFAGIFLRFDIFAAVYARVTTEMLKTVLNNPARAVLYNFFPEKHRSMIRLVLRGSVVRAADFAGSGFLTLIRGVVEPRMLSLVALPFALIWVVTSFRLKKAYPGILLQSIKENQMDWKQMEDDQLQLIAKDKLITQTFQQGLASKDGKVALLCGEFLSRTQPDQWVEHLLSVIAQKEPGMQKQLLDFLTPENIGSHRPRMYELARSVPLEALPYWLEALTRIDPSESGPFMEEFLFHPDDRVKAEAFTGSCLSCNLDHREAYWQRINEWLAGDRSLVRLAVKVLAKTGDSVYSRELEEIFSQTEEPDLKAWALEGLSKMNHDRIISLSILGSTDTSYQVRRASLRALSAVEPEVSPELLMAFLKDVDSHIRSEASQILAKKGEQIIPVLLKGLAQPSRSLKEEIVLLLDRIGVPKADLSRFVLDQLKLACHYLSFVNVLENYKQGDSMGLFKNGLKEKHQEIIEIVLRVMGVIEFGDQMRVILRAVQSGKQKDIDIVIEVLGNAIHSDLRHALIPLLENTPITERLTASCKALGIHPVILTSFEQVFALISEDADTALKALCLYASGENQELNINTHAIRRFLNDPDSMVREAAEWVIHRRENNGSTQLSQNAPGLVEKIMCLEKKFLFKGLKTCELLPIARLCRSVTCQAGEILFQKNQKATDIYLLYQGELAGEYGFTADPATVAFDLLLNEFAGEMQWIDGDVQLYTLKAKTVSFLLEMAGKDFCRIMEEFPLVVLNLCRIYSGQLRVYHQIVSKHNRISH